MIAATELVLAVAAVLFLARLLRGPTLADRVLALDGILYTVVGLAIVEAVDDESPLLLDVPIVVAFIGFIGTAVVARFIEERGG